MALHGQVMVNHKVIGEWSATRTHREIREINTYRCAVVTQKGKLTFTVDHTPTDGALVLAIKVLTEAKEYV